MEDIISITPSIFGGRRDRDIYRIRTRRLDHVADSLTAPGVVRVCVEDYRDLVLPVGFNLNRRGQVDMVVRVV